MLKKILTINEKYSDNIGDQAISRAMIEFCNFSNDVSVDAVDFSFRQQFVPISDAATKGTKLVTLKRFIPALAKKIIFFMKNINNAKNISRCGYDLAIIGGGQLLLGRGTFPFSLFLYTFFLHKAGTRIKIVAAGVGKSFSGLERFLIAQSLKRVEAIYLRDIKSIDNLKNNFNKHSGLIPDIAYFLYNETKISKLGNKIIICPTEYSVYKRYEDEVGHKNLSFDDYKNTWLKIIRNNIDKYDEIVLSATTNNDYKFCESLINYLSKLELAKVKLKKTNSVDDFISLAEESSEIISGRMHALILCHNLNIKITPFYISQKIIAYKDEYLDNDAKFINRRILDMRMEIIR